MLVVHATFPIDPKNREEALDHVEELVEASRQESGVVEYDAATDVLDPNHLRFTEVYDDEEAFGAHSGTEHYQKFEQALPDLLAGEPKVMQYEVTDANELEL